MSAPTAIRPNGKPYCRRKSPAVSTYASEWSALAGVIVLRTHDRDEAHRIASQALAELAYEYDMEPIQPEDGELGWLRLVPWDDSRVYDQSWVGDPVRGVPCVTFRGAE